MKFQKGFALIETVLLVVLIAILAGTGWYVTKARSSSNKTLNNAQSVAIKSSTPAKTASAVTSCGTVDSSQTSGSVDVQSDANGSSSSSDFTFTGPNAAKYTASQQCFDQKFAACQPATYDVLGPVDMGSVNYEIKGSNRQGCSMTLVYPKNPNPDWVNKDLTCTYDNKKNLNDATNDVFNKVFDKQQTVCTGPLVAVMQAMMQSSQQSAQQEGNQLFGQ